MTLLSAAYRRNTGVQVVVSGARGTSDYQLWRLAGNLGSYQDYLDYLADRVIANEPGFKGDKGDPGGNAMSIGLFTAGSGIAVPAGTDIVQTSGHTVRGSGPARYVYDPAVDAAFVVNYPRLSFITTNGRGFRLAETDIDVKMFGARGDNSTDDTDAIQAALIYMFYLQLRSLHFPQGIYCISDTLLAPASLSGLQFTGSSGYDGTRGPRNFSMRTALKWIGPTSPAKPMVKFDRCSGVLWRGISLDGNYKAGYGLQFMSSTQTDGSVKNIVENLGFSHILRDGCIVGEWGTPTAGPSLRQFFGYVFRNITAIGCAVSAIHINEWNADQPLFDTVMVYHDDPTNEADRLLCDNGIWFDHGGQWYTMINCQEGGTDVQPGKPHSGYFIRNQGNDQSSAGAFGGVAIGCWKEGAGGLYYGVTGSNEQKGFTFIQCSAFTSDTNNPSVYIDKGTDATHAYTFHGCTFWSDIKIDSSTLQHHDLDIGRGTTFVPGRGVIDAMGRRILDGLYDRMVYNSTAEALVAPRLADTLIVTLAVNVPAVYAEAVAHKGHELKIIVTQDGNGGHIVNWPASGSFKASPAIPQPTAAPNTTSVYTFVSNGTQYWLASVVLG